jgi:hypothetical protein
MKKTLQELEAELLALQDAYQRQYTEEKMAEFDIKVGDRFTSKKGHNADGLEFTVTGIMPSSSGGYQVEGIETKVCGWDPYYLNANWDKKPRA